MSQNKTVFPGMGNEGDYSGNRPGGGAPTPDFGNPYSRRDHSSSGTVFPGMEQAAGMPPQPATPAQPHQPQSRPKAGGKPVVGFLYSISRTLAGEYWPLHIGQNVIGSGSDCDIRLQEGTVSRRHASLHINKMKKPEKTEATISELGSTNGTLLNDCSVSVARPMECVNGDILVIGENYQMLVVLIDAKAMGLEPSPNFIDTAKEEEEDYMPGVAMPGVDEGATINRQDLPPSFAGPDPYDGSHRPSDSTVGLDSGQNQFRAGFTKGI